MTILYKDKSQSKLGDFLVRLPFRRRPLLATTALFVGAFSIFYLFVFWSLRHLSYGDPTSYFFDEDKAYQRQYSLRRVEEVESYLKDAGQHVKPVRAPGPIPRICVGVATVGRRGEQYVGLTVGSLLDGLSKSERDDTFLNLFIAHTVPSRHPVYAEKWVDQLPDRVLDYNNNMAMIEVIRLWENDGWYRNKTIYDYTYLLEDCYNTGAEYVAMVEDDTIAVEGWYAKVLKALDVVESQMRSRNRNQAEKWVYLRMFYADELLGWNSEQWPRYLFWSLAIWATLTGIMYWFRRQSKQNTDSSLVAVIVFISCIAIPASIALFFMAGRQTVWPIATGVSEMNKYGCCSQGLIFPRSIIPDLLAHTDLTTDWLVDMMMEKIADEEGWTRWVTVPSLLQHIGATSSKGYGFDDSAKTLWNFRFENSWR